MDLDQHFDELARKACKTGSRQRVPGKAKIYILRYLVRGALDHEFIGPNRFGNIGLASALGFSIDEEKYSPQSHRRRLRKLLASAEKSASKESIPVLEANLDSLEKVASLTRLERDVLGVVVLSKTVTAFTQLGFLIGELETGQLHETIAIMLDVDVGGVRAALSRQGALHKAGILSVDQSDNFPLQLKVDLLKGFGDRVMSEVAQEPLDLLGGAVVRSPAPTLSLSDFDDHMPLVRLAKDLVRQTASQGNTPVSVLLWGVAGCGKTEAARLIAQEAGFECFEVATTTPDGGAVDVKGRLKAFKAAQRLLASRPAVLLYDEASDLFEMRMIDGGDAVSKGSLNELIEATTVPTIFVLNENEMGNVAPAFLRRFSLCIEGKCPPTDRRRALLREAAGDYLDDGLIDTVVAEPRATPAIMKRATEVVDLVGRDAPSEKRRRMFCQIVEGVMRPQTNSPLVLDQRLTASDPFQLYDHRFVNSSMNLAEIVESVRRHRSLRILLSGPPGTGKTAWGKALAKALGQPLQLEKTSDILSPLVGMTEAKIAGLFARARREGTVLQIDEIDSIARSRSSAKNHWETTQVNELLTQLDNFDGVIVMTCNHEEVLTSALSRRCDIKARLDYLRADQSCDLLVKYCEWLHIEAPSVECLERLSRLRGLAVGDYANLSKQHRLLPIASADDFVMRLADEVAHKREDEARPRMGFVP